MNYSVRQLASLMIVLLVVVTLGSSAIGFYLLQGYYVTEETRMEAQARQRLQLAAGTVGNQIQFYQGIVDLLAGQNTAVDLLSFSDESEIQGWALKIRSVLPGAFGLALSRADGAIIGDPLIQRIGEVCQRDLAHFSQNHSSSYPPYHDSVAGLEHFDLFSKVDSEDGGVLLVSFHTENLHRIMQQVLSPGDQLILLTGNGREITRAGSNETRELAVFTQPVPNSSWEMQLQTPPINPPNFFQHMFLLNLVMLLTVTSVLLLSTRRFASMISEDMRRIQNRVAAVLEDKETRLQTEPMIREIGALVPDIDRLALSLRERQQELKDQSLTDPLTQLGNRRSFRILTEQAFAQSTRGISAVLLIIDVNDFKEVNDTKGHDVGDQALIDIADSLQRHTRASDALMRIGGDEFAVILQQFNLAQLPAWLDNLVAQYDRDLAVRRPPGLGPSCCTLSIGATGLDASTYETIEEVLHDADQAMYAAKKSSTVRSRYHIVTDREPPAHGSTKRASTT